MTAWKKHNFSKIFSYQDFCNNVPVEIMNSSQLCRKIEGRRKMSCGQENQSILPKPQEQQAE